MFYNPQQSGAGVAKNAAEPKPFFKFWELFGRKFGQLIVLNMFYLVLCVPVITVGPATAALTSVMRKFVLEQPIFVAAEFFAAFKKNFKARTVAFGIVTVLLFVVFVFSMSYYVALVNAYPGAQSYFMMAMCIVAGVVFLTMNLYIYPQIAYLDLKTNSIIKNALIFCLAGFKRNVVTVFAILGVLAALVLTYPYSVVALPFAPLAQLAFLSVFNSHPVIQKYVIAPFYEANSELNPEVPVETTSALFTDLGGSELPVDKKSVKSTGKVIK